LVAEERGYVRVERVQARNPRRAVLQQVLPDHLREERIARLARVEAVAWLNNIERIAAERDDNRVDGFVVTTK
jgi:hypothetical protein